MKIAIVAPSPVPFSIGGAEKLWWGLQRYINQLTPHHAELIKLPTREHGFWELLASYREFSGLDLSHFDLVISTKYPAWMVRHSHHVCYLQHRLRGLYDTYHLTGLPEDCESTHPEMIAGARFLQTKRGDPGSLEEGIDRIEALRQSHDVPDSAFAFPGPLSRLMVRFLDDAALHPSRIRRYSAISRNVANRDGYFPPGANVTVLHHPSDLPDFVERTSDYLFTISRLDNAKRVRLLIEAMRQADADIQLKIAGSGPEEKSLKDLARGDPRIEFLGFVSDQEAIELYGGALAVLYAPYDEDYGLVPIEAMRSGKPVITTTDAGGPREFVVDRETGFVVAPEARELARAIDHVFENRSEARAMSTECRRRVASITWERVVNGLLGSPGKRIRARGIRKRRKLTLASTFPIYPPRGGGQTRIFELYRNLATDFDVDIVSFTEHDQPTFDQEIADGLREIRVPKSLEHARAEWKFSEQLNGIPVTDVVMPRLYQQTPAYVEALRRSVVNTDLLIASHPYLLPALKSAGNGHPLLYEAHNVESDLKRDILPGDRLGRYFLRVTERVERQASRCSRLIVTCSEQDATTLNERFGVAADKISVAPNGVDTGAVRFREFRDRRRERGSMDDNRFTVLFMGSWHGPNIDAALALLEVARRVPQVRVMLVGSVCEYLRRWHFSYPANVELAGVVDEANKNETLGWVDLAVNPTETGSGTNLKMLDYLAAGVPVLTTPFGGRGLELEDGVHARIAPMLDFPAEIERTRTAPDEALSRMVRNAREHVEAQFTWRGIADRLATRIREAYFDSDSQSGER